VVRKFALGEVEKLGKHIRSSIGVMRGEWELLTEPNSDCRPHHFPTTTSLAKDSSGVDSSRYVEICCTIIKGIKAYGLIGIVVGIAVGAAFYSMGRKLVVDKQMRLSRQNRKE
jgi:hypothetical protein